MVLGIWRQDGEVEWMLVSDNKPVLSHACCETGGVWLGVRWFDGCFVAWGFNKWGGIPTNIGLVVTGAMEFYDFPFSWEFHHPN